ncbi:MAG TPA: (2Fe-2S)-binding protein [Candidatus Binatia bacterium]|nr:(2Fe-2S)-binding protein [Candidatus Binatia bacterium]
MKRDVCITINGEPYAMTVDHRLLLVDFIRELAGLTGTQVGCSVEGRCGACTVIMDGKAVKSCLLLAVQADGAQIMTVEGLARGDKLHPIQEGFWEKHGLQCGFCTPGLLMTLYEFLKVPKPTEEEIRAAMSGVICRCTGYVHIVEAVKHAIAKVEAMSAEERKEWFPL